eukprot:3997145-Amphidinium_carterae.1
MDTCHVRRKQAGPPRPPNQRSRLSDTKRCWQSSARILMDLLDHYFDHFSLQHSRLLLYNAEDRKDKWQWRLSVVAAKFTRVGIFLKKLGRKADAIVSDDSGSNQVTGHKVVCKRRPEDGEICVELVQETELRMHVLAGNAPEWVQKHLTLPREELYSSCRPSNSAVVLSMALACQEMQDLEERRALSPADRQKWHRKVVRQLLAFEADIICLQRCQAHIDRSCCNTEFEELTSAGGVDLLSAVVERLQSEDYEFCAAPVVGVDNTLLHRAN